MAREIAGAGRGRPASHAMLRGYLCIAAAALCWGGSATLGKAAFSGRLVSGPGLTAIGPLILSQMRTTISVLVLLPIILILRGRAGLRMPLRDVLRAMSIGILGLAASNYAYYAAIDRTSVATAIILQYTAPVWVLLYMVARGQQRATWQRVSAVALSVAGSMLAIGLASGGRVKLNVAGIAWAQVAALSFAFYNVAGHWMLERHERWKVIVYAMLGASVFWLILNPPWRVMAAHYSRGQWAFLALFAVTSMLVPFSLYFAGLVYLDATRAIVTSCLEPVFAILFAAMYVGEAVTPLQVVGIAIVLVATVMVQMRGTDAQGERAEAVVQG